MDNTEMAVYRALRRRDRHQTVVALLIGIPLAVLLLGAAVLASLP